ncbi:MAG: hypothetical protein IAE90_16120 [Ignavibacteria bacterium]|nr:hypothetical protein [Ignavibacteria bacterium]
MKAILIILTLFLSLGCTILEKKPEQSAEQHRNFDAGSDELEFLRKMKDKYPFEVDLLQNKIIKDRLAKLLGDRFEFIKNISELGPSTPIEVSGNIFSSYTCMQHNCGFTNYIIVADIAKNEIYVGIREEEKVKLYSENENSPFPEVLINWSNK